MCFEQDATLGGDLPPLLQKSSVLRAASALGIAGEKAKSIAFTPYKAWVPQATTVLIYVCGNIYIYIFESDSVITGYILSVNAKYYY